MSYRIEKGCTCSAIEPATGHCRFPTNCSGSILRQSGYGSADGLPTETGIAPIDSAIVKTLAFEQSYLGNPLVQVALLGFAGFGIYTLAAKFIK